MSRRSVRIIDFDIAGSAPESSEIRCAQLGKASHQIIVTGDDRKNVSLWRTSKSTAVLTFQGHSSDITAVTFSQQEDFVYSGSFGGTVLVWDLNQQKAAFSLNSHRAACTALAPLPRTHQAMLASGSADCTLKIWDLRKKHCVQTFKGHEGKIGTLAFSPDCKWVASGSDDGCVKVWDLVASKKIFELQANTAGVTVIKFNPTTMTLAAGYQDRVVRYWNLETQSLESSTSPDSLPIHQICFDPKTGTMLFSAIPNSLKLWHIEQGFLCDTIQTDWRNIADLEVNTVNEVLIGLSYGSGTFSVYTTDLNTVRMDVNRGDEMRVDPLFRGNMPKPRLAPVDLIPQKQSDADSPNMQLILEVQEEHKQMVTLLAQRNRTLKELGGMWAGGQMMETLRVAEGLKDPAIVRSLLEDGVVSGSATLSLDLCPNLLSLSQSLIEAKFEAFIKVGLRTVAYLLKNFFDIIAGMLATPVMQGVDLSREDRMRKCERCFNSFLAVKTNPAFEKMCTRTGEAGDLARSLSDDLSRFLWKCGRRQ